MTGYLRLRKHGELVLLALYAGQHYEVINVSADCWGIASYASGSVLQVQPCIIATCKNKAEATALLERLATKVGAEEV